MSRSSVFILIMSIALPMNAAYAITFPADPVAAVPAPPVEHSTELTFPNEADCIARKNKDCSRAAICLEPAGSTPTNISAASCSPNADGTWSSLCTWECS